MFQCYDSMYLSQSPILTLVVISTLLCQEMQMEKSNSPFQMNYWNVRVYMCMCVGVGGCTCTCISVYVCVYGQVCTYVRIVTNICTYIKERGLFG